MAEQHVSQGPVWEHFQSVTLDNTEKHSNTYPETDGRADKSIASHFTPRSTISHAPPFTPHPPISHVSPFNPCSTVSHASSFAPRSTVSHASSFAPRSNISHASPITPRSNVSHASTFRSQHKITQLTLAHAIRRTTAVICIDEDGNPPLDSTEADIIFGYPKLQGFPRAFKRQRLDKRRANSMLSRRQPPSYHEMQAPIYFSDVNPVAGGHAMVVQGLAVHARHGLDGFCGLGSILVARSKELMKVDSMK